MGKHADFPPWFTSPFFLGFWAYCFPVVAHPLPSPLLLVKFCFQRYPHKYRPRCCQGNLWSSLSLSWELTVIKPITHGHFCCYSNENFSFLWWWKGWAKKSMCIVTEDWGLFILSICAEILVIFSLDTNGWILQKLKITQYSKHILYINLQKHADGPWLRRV